MKALTKFFKKTAYVLLLAAVIFVTAVFSSITYAWLVNYVKSDFKFTTGEAAPFSLKIAKIMVTDRTVVYTEANRGYYDTVKNTSTKEEFIEANEDGTHLEVALENMSFGSIDNVAQLKEENIVYLRLTVPKTTGNAVKVNLHYKSDSFISLHKNTYDADGNVNGTETVTGDTITKLQGVETTANDSYLLFDAVATKEDYAATAIATNLGSQFKDENYKRFVKKPATGSTDTTDYDNNTLTAILSDTEYNNLKDTENYYVYIKVVPNLEVFAHSIEHITEYMPCFMYFNIEAEFETLYQTAPQEGGTT